MGQREQTEPAGMHSKTISADYTCNLADHKPTRYRPRYGLLSDNNRRNTDRIPNKLPYDHLNLFTSITWSMIQTAYQPLADCSTCPQFIADTFLFDLPSRDADEQALVQVISCFFLWSREAVRLKSTSSRLGYATLNLDVTCLSVAWVRLPVTPDVVETGKVPFQKC